MMFSTYVVHLALSAFFSYLRLFLIKMFSFIIVSHLNLLFHQGWKLSDICQISITEWSECPLIFLIFSAGKKELLHAELQVGS